MKRCNLKKCHKGWIDKLHDSITKILRLFVMKSASSPNTVLVAMALSSVTLFTAGFYTNFKLETDFGKVFSPTNSRAVIYADWIADTSVQPNKYGIDLLIHKSGENILTKNAVEIAFQVLETLQNTTGFSRACLGGYGTSEISRQDANKVCDFLGITNIFGNSISNFTAMIDNDETFIETLSAESTLNNPVVSDMYFGLPTRNVTNDNQYGDIISAQSLRIQFLLPTHLVDGLNYNKGVATNPRVYYDEHFEKAAIEGLLELKHNLQDAGSEYVLEMQSYDSLVSEGERAIRDDLPLIGIVLVLIGFITSSVFFKRDQVQSSTLMGMGAVMTVVFSGMASFGLLFLCGISFTNLTLTVVFVLFGIGLDDTFIICGAFQRTDSSLEVNERLDEAIKECGVSVVLTTLTTVSAFLFGMISPVQGLRDYYTYASVSVLIDFVYQITFFVAILYKNEKRIQDSRYDCLVCVKRRGNTNNQGRKASIDSISSTLSDVLVKYYDLLLVSKAIRIFVIAAFTSLFISASTYFYQLEVRFTSEDFLPDNSFIKQYLGSRAKYMDSTDTDRRILFFRHVDFADEYVRELMKNYVDTIASQPEVPFNPTNFWVKEIDNFGNDSLEFEEKLRLFMEDESLNDIYGSQLIWDEQGDLVASMLPIQTDFINVDESVKQVNFMKSMQKIDDQFYSKTISWNSFLKSNPDMATNPESYPFFSFKNDDVFWEFFDMVPKELRTTTLCAFLVISFWVIFLVKSLWANAVVLPIVVMIFVDILGIMKWSGFFINPMTMLAIIISLGLLIDFVLHVVMTSLRIDSLTGNNYVDVRECLQTIGTSVFVGGLTTVVSTMPLLFSSSKIFQAIFVIFFSMVTLSLTHGLFLVPAILVFLDKTHNGNAQTIEDAKHASNDGSKGSSNGMKYDLGRDDASLDSFGGKVESNDGSKGSSNGMKYDLGRDDALLDSFGGKVESNDGSKGSSNGMKYDLGRDDALLDSFGGKVESNDGSKGSSNGMKYDLGRDDALLDSFGGKVESNDGSKDSTDGVKYDLGRDRIFFDTDLASDVEISSRSDSSNISEGSSFYTYDSNDEGNDEGVC